MRDFLKKCKQDNISGMSARSAYYLLFAFFPIVILISNIIWMPQVFSIPSFVREMTETIDIPIATFAFLLWPMWRGIRAILRGIRRINGRKMRLKEIYLGALLTLAFWTLTTLGFNFYMRHFCNYEKIYGQIGTFLGFALWLYVMSFTLFFSAEVNIAIQYQKLKHV